jgi:hypothetical protein
MLAMIKCYDCDGVGEKYYQRMFGNEYDAGTYICPTCDGAGEVPETIDNVCQALWSSRCNALYYPSKEPEWHPSDEFPEGFDANGQMYLYVRIAGDSESVDGYTLYNFPDYCTLMQVHRDNDNFDVPMPLGFGFADEEWDNVIEWAYISPEHLEELTQEVKRLYVTYKA